MSKIKNKRPVASPEQSRAARSATGSAGKLTYQDLFPRASEGLHSPMEPPLRVPDKAPIEVLPYLFVIDIEGDLGDAKETIVKEVKSYYSKNREAIHKSMKKAAFDAVFAHGIDLSTSGVTVTTPALLDKLMHKPSDGPSITDKAKTKAREVATKAARDKANQILKLQLHAFQNASSLGSWIRADGKWVIGGAILIVGGAGYVVTSNKINPRQAYRELNSSGKVDIGGRIIGKAKPKSVEQAGGNVSAKISTFQFQENLKDWDATGLLEAEFWAVGHFTGAIRFNIATSSSKDFEITPEMQIGWQWGDLQLSLSGKAGAKDASLSAATTYNLGSGFEAYVSQTWLPSGTSGQGKPKVGLRYTINADKLFD